MKKPQSTTTLFIVSISIILISRNILRILNVPITHDEARTYLTYVSSTFKNITICNPITANNHIFNSLLTKCFVISRLQVPVDLNDGEPPTADTSFEYYYIDEVMYGGYPQFINQ